MNSKIEELIVKSGLEWCAQQEQDKQNLEEFAERIVKECALTVESLTVHVSDSFTDWDYGYNKAIRTGSKVILQRFGLPTNYEQHN